MLINWVVVGGIAWLLLLVATCVHSSIARKTLFARKRVENAKAKGMSYEQYEAWIASMDPKNGRLRNRRETR